MATNFASFLGFHGNQNAQCHKMTWRSLNTLWTCMYDISFERESPQHSYRGWGFWISTTTTDISINIYIHNFINHYILGLFLRKCVKHKTLTPHKKAGETCFPMMYNTHGYIQYPDCARPFYSTRYFGYHGNPILAPKLLPWQRGGQTVIMLLKRLHLPSLSFFLIIVFILCNIIANMHLKKTKVP